jgi:lamin tail-like protein
MTLSLVGTGLKRAPSFVFALITAAALGCGSDGTEPQVHTVASIDVSLKSELEIGEKDTAAAIARDESGAPIAGAAVSWSSTFPDVAVITPEGEISTKAIGTTEIVAGAGGKVVRKQLTVLPPPLLINEVNPDGDLTGGWIEVFNSTPHAIDLAGWFIVTVIGPTHVELYTFPTGSVIGPGEFVVVDETMIPGLLNASGTVALFSKFGVESDAMTWTANASGTAYARCPDNDRFGALVSTSAPTRKAPNVCRT